MIDEEIMSAASDDDAPTCNSFDKFILALFAFGCGVFVTGMVLYWLS